MVVCIHCDLIPAPPLSRRRIAEPAACALQGQALLVSAGSGSPSLVASCNKFIPSLARDFMPDITRGVSTASHLSAFRVNSLTARTASDISDFRPFSFRRKNCFTNTRAVHFHQVFVRNSGRSRLRDGHVPHYAAVRLHLAQLIKSNRAGSSPFVPASPGRARHPRWARLFFDPRAPR